jgi:hypothetical protein
VQAEHIHDGIAAAPYFKKSSPIEKSSPRQITRPVRFIEECHIASFALSVAEEVLVRFKELIMSLSS